MSDKYEKFKKQAENIFKDHVAHIIVDNEHCCFIDWRHINGGVEYAIRYILDLDNGDIVITGDFGSAIASWYGKKTAETLISYVHDVGYFADKIKCSTDLHTYYESDVLEDLEEIKKDLINDGYEEDEVNQDFEELASFIEDAPHDRYNGTYYTSQIQKVMENYEINWWDTDLMNAGKRLSARVIFWQTGLLMAWEYLKKNK